MRLTFLGTGTSFGIPVVGCDCPRCTSSDPRDRRTRHAALLQSDDRERSLLVDTPPELRLQLLRTGVRDVDAVWFTHQHADHTAGMDDLRVFSARRRRHLPAWAAAPVASILRERFDYIFDPSLRVPEGTTKPEIELNIFRPFEEVEIAGFRLLPLAVPHGDVASYGFRAGGLGYLTDAQSVPSDVRDALRGVDVLVLSALWYGHPHPTHMTVEEAIEVGRDIGARRTLLVHLTHRVGHGELVEKLPVGIEPAHDGLSIEI